MIEMTGKKVTTLHRSFQYLKVVWLGGGREQTINQQQNRKNSGKGCFCLGINTIVLLKEKATAGMLRRYKMK